MEQRLDLNGLDFTEGYVAVIDKPLRWTSADVVRKIKFTLNKKGYKKIKVGHAGTLDPLATGVLIVCIGRATKMVDTFQAKEKEYTASLELGATTPSFDMEHPVDHRYPYEHITREAACEAAHGRKAPNAARILGQEDRRRARLRDGPRGRGGSRTQGAYQHIRTGDDAFRASVHGHTRAL